MEIKYYGHSCFRIKGKNVTVVTDPYSSDLGWNLPKIMAEIVTISHHHFDHDNLTAITGTTVRLEPFVVDGPGEYEILGVFIYGFASFHDNKSGALRGQNTIYLINIDGLKVAHLGDLGEKLNDRLREELNGVEVLLLPVGGNYTIDAIQAVEVINQIEPKIVIPMHYRLPGTKIQEIAEVEEFLKEAGVTVAPIDKLNITKDKLPQNRQIILLNARN